MEFYDYDEDYRTAIHEGLEQALAQLTPEQLERLAETNIEDLVSTAVSDAVVATTKGLVEQLKRDAPGMLEHRRDSRMGFESRLAKHWGRAFDFSEAVLTVAYEAGDFFNQKHRLQGDSEPDQVFEALIRLHARACRITEEILVLLKAGFGQAGHARWRVLHEVAVIADFIADNGAKTAERYFAHEVVETWRGMQEFQRHAARLGETPYSDEEVHIVERAFDAAIAKYAPKFAGPYGWAQHALIAKDPRFVRDRPVTFAAIEESVGVDHMRPYYRMASHGMHANPKGITFTPDLMAHEHVLLTGGSNAGLADPGIAMLSSLTWITATLLGSNPGEALAFIIGAMVQLRDEGAEAYLDSHRALDESTVSLGSTEGRQAAGTQPN